MSNLKDNANVEKEVRETLVKLFETLQAELEKKPLCPETILALSEAIKAF